MKTLTGKSCLAILLACGLSGVAFAKPGQPFELQVQTPASLLPGANGTAVLKIVMERSATSLTYRAQGRGMLASYSEQRTLTGPWKEGQEVQISAPIAAGNGEEGGITFEIMAVDGAQPAGKVTALLFAARDQDRVWLSGSSEIDLKLNRLETLKNEGALSPEDFQLAVESVIKGSVAVDYVPKPAEPMDIAAWRLQDAAETSLPELTRLRTDRITPKTAANITVKGHVEWTDSAGGKHGLPFATVEIRDEEVIGSDLIATTMTDAAGNYASSFSFDDGLLQGDPDIFVRVFARSPAADIKPDTASGVTYFKESPVQNEVPTGSTIDINFTIGNVADEDTVFSVHHALVMIGTYAGKLAGVMPSQVDTRFPTTKSTSLFNGTQLHILKLDRWDWDVIHHEYGHYFMSVHGFQNNPGGSHSFGSNLASTRSSKDVGIRLAWGEGWPTFFGTAGQVSLGASALAIPNVGDTSYTDTEDSSNNVNLETSTGLGEDNEVSVMTALWDIYDGSNDGLDKVAYGDQSMFTTFKASAPTTMGAAWEALAASQDTRGKTLLGSTLGQANIAPVLQTPADNVTIDSATPPTFTWLAKGGGTPNPLNDFRIRFYKNNFSSIIFEKELGNVTTYTPSAADWGTIVGGDSIVKWVIEGKNTSAPATPGGALDHYWSEARSLGGIQIVFVIDDTGSMGEEIDGVKEALQFYIDLVGATLPAGTPAPTMQLITFKDSVTTRLTSNDLAAMRTAVGGLFASGGGDCPEFGAQALEVAAENIAGGGTILFATDASSQPGVDIGAVIAKLRAKGATVNTILSGDCSGIGSSSVGITSSRPVFSQKPGDEDLPQGPITDPGQIPIDNAGDTPALAAVLPLGDLPVTGSVGVGTDLADYYVFGLEAGKTYAVRFTVTSGSVAASTFTLLQPNGSTQIQSRTVFDGLPKQFTFVPTVTTNYFLKVAVSSAANAVTYSIAVNEDPYAALANAVEMFSAISLQSGGVFLLRDGVNSGDPASYVAAMRNVMTSTLGPATLAANPGTVQQGATMSVTLRGRNTNWRPGSVVSFSGSGITIASTDVRSATLISMLVNVSTNATLGFRDTTVTTSLGSRTETAIGASVVQVVAASTSPAILSVEPNEISQGTNQTILIRGVNTSWTTNSTVQLSSTFTIESVTVLSPTLIQVQVSVPDNAKVGFYTATVLNPGASSQSMQRAIFLNSRASTLPQITSITPAEGGLGEHLVITVHGANTHFEPGTTTASFGSGITVGSVDVTDSTTAEVTITVNSSAGAGFRDVSLTTGSETAVLLQGFFVSTGPGVGLAARPQLVDDLTALRSQAQGKDRVKLTEALALLRVTLKPILWTGNDTLEPRAGGSVFVADINVAARLAALYKDRRSAVSKESLKTILDTLVRFDKQQAQRQVDIATANGLPAPKVNKATADIAKGDILADQLTYPQALKQYYQAWRRAK